MVWSRRSATGMVSAARRHTPATTHDPITMPDQTPRLSDLAERLPVRSAHDVPGDPRALDPAVLVLDAPAGIHPLATPSDRRTFLARASALSLAIPGVGAALAACSPNDRGTREDSARAAGTPAT